MGTDLIEKDENEIEENKEINNLNDELVHERSETISHKNNALKRLDTSFIKHIELSEYKKANLLAFWIEDFSSYHDEEKLFDSSSLKTFKRGDIVKVNLGFNIGKEFGGLHYCIVINKNDNPYSQNLNVIPLSSIKKDKVYNSTTCVNLKDELFLLLSKKLEEGSLKLNKQIQLHNNETDIHKQNEILQPLIKTLRHLQKLEKELSKMKHGSVAYVHQITTISKQRIFKTPILSGIKLSNHSLDLIDDKIAKLFMK